MLAHVVVQRRVLGYACGEWVWRLAVVRSRFSVEARLGGGSSAAAHEVVAWKGRRPLMTFRAKWGPPMLPLPALHTSKSLYHDFTP